VKRLTRLTPVLVLALGGAIATGCLAGAPAPEPLNPVRFLLISDLTTPDTASASESVGLAQVATVRKRIADQGPLLFVAAGNILGRRPGGPRTSIGVLNAAHLNYATFGTDELALPADTLARRVAASKFTWLSSNCTLTGTAPVPQNAAKDSAGAGTVLPWDTLSVSKHKIGIFGLTRPAHASDSGGSASALRCGDPDSAAKRAIDTLVAQGVELVVAITNQPTARDRNLLLQQPKLDLVLGGAERDPQTATIAERHVLKPGAAARAAQFVTLWGGKEKWRQAVGLVRIDGRLPADTAVARAEKQIPAD